MTAGARELPRSVVEKVRKASVEVHIRGQLRGGGAFVRDSSGRVFVVTAAHLFSSPRETCIIFTEDDASHFASLSAYNLGHDLALLEVPPDTSRYGSLEVAAAVPAETSSIYNFAPALRRRTLVLPGTVADSRVSYTDFSSSRDYLSHFFAAGINPVLTSGGVWVDQAGRVVGIQHGRLIGDQGAPSSGLSMVSTPEAVRRLLEDRAIASTPGLGGYVWETSTSDPSLREELPRGIEGLVVKPVFENRPLHRAGVREFDVIVSVDGEPVRRREHLLGKVRSRPPGESFVLEVVSPGRGGPRRVELRTDRLEDHWK